MKELIAGCISGISQVLLSHPLDTIKTRLQYNNTIKLQPKYLYAGLKYPLINSIIINGLLFKLNTIFYEETNNYYISGGLTGCIIGIVRNPLEIHKIKRQNEKDINLKKNIKDIIKYNYRGLIPTLFREIIGKTIFFGLYYNNRDKYNILLVGGVSGLLMWSITYPIDVIKTRIQTDHNINLKKVIKQGNFNKGFIPCVIRSFLVNSLGFYVYELFYDLI